MTMIFSPDALRAKTEKESLGRRTVIYSAKGQPNFMYQICRDDLSAPHPAFCVNGQIIDAFFYACYPGSLYDGELISQPGKAPACHLNLPEFRLLAQQTGPGFHLSSNAEWAALMHCIDQQNVIPDGNTDYGRSLRHPEQHAVRIDGKPAGDLSGEANTLTGSSHPDWYHNQQLTGISDLCGNLWEWQTGVRLMAGEIQLVRDNDISVLPADAPLLWQSVNMQSGQYCEPGIHATAKYDSPSACLTGNGGTPLLSGNITCYNGDPGDNSYPPGLLDGPFFSMETTDNLPAPHLLQLNGLAPYEERPRSDQIYLRNYGERALMRGGAWYSQEFSGISAFCLSHTALHRSATVGGRTAWIAPNLIQLNEK
ncbi:MULTISPECIES: hypothetical protein [Morganella]|uniref:hypothetical protein n=1 Tax=Morganella TaxID=581 RepID=UPI001C486626|nr:MULTISPECIES: hypothetical protein [Morganella]QXO63724.1 hypothetical protein JC825_09670 [Morganella morganii]